MTRCDLCPVPDHLACFAAEHGLIEWCIRDDMRMIALGRSLGLIVDVRGPAPPPLTDSHKAADLCPDADRRWDGCACIDRVCRRHSKIVGGLDCLLCVAHGVVP